MQNTQLIKLNSTIDNLVQKEKNNKNRLVQNSSVYCLRSLFVNNLLKEEKFKQSPYRKIILNYLENAEYVMKGGSYLLLSLYLNNFYNKESNSSLAENNINNLNKMIDIMTNSIESSSLVKDILHFSGPDSSILCKKNNNSIVEVNQKIDSQIHVNLCEDFINMYFKSQKSVTKSFLTVCMDAYIERESEISLLIDKAIKDKQNILIFARGYSQNFKRNIKNIIVNSGVLIYPYEVKFNNEDPFLLSDISEIIDIDVYSLEKGDNITKNLVEKSKIKTLKVNPHNITFFETNKKLLKKINESLKSTNDSDLRKYLLKRKKRVSSNITEVLIPKDKNNLFEEIKNIIHCYNNCSVSGFVEYEDYIYPRNVFNKINKLSKNLEKTLKNISVVVKLKDKSNV
tara:strand:- start:184 stop:1380 length:1197 start_codon:yes stop_codon:yes gene_type:complete